MTLTSTDSSDLVRGLAYGFSDDELERVRAATVGDDLGELGEALADALVFRRAAAVQGVMAEDDEIIRVLAHLKRPLLVQAHLVLLGIDGGPDRLAQLVEDALDWQQAVA